MYYKYLYCNTLHFRGNNVYEELEIILTSLTKERFLSHMSLLTTDFHVLPDFHGNRSPLADPTLKGMVNIELL